jgi:hypothetical protein
VRTGISNGAQSASTLSLEPALRPTARKKLPFVRDSISSDCVH